MDARMFPEQLQAGLMQIRFSLLKPIQQSDLITQTMVSERMQILQDLQQVQFSRETVTLSQDAHRLKTTQSLGIIVDQLTGLTLIQNHLRQVERIPVTQSLDLRRAVQYRIMAQVLQAELQAIQNQLNPEGPIQAIQSPVLQKEPTQATADQIQEIVTIPEAQILAIVSQVLQIRAIHHTVSQAHHQEAILAQAIVSQAHLQEVVQAIQDQAHHQKAVQVIQGQAHLQEAVQAILDQARHQEAAQALALAVVLLHQDQVALLQEEADNLI